VYKVPVAQMPLVVGARECGRVFVDSGGSYCVVSTRNVTAPDLEETAASEIYPEPGKGF
jgi:hypothetical protein